MNTRTFASPLAAPALALAGILALPLAASADDDRFPTSEELGQIESSLNGAGYTSWDDIEFDDGLWEVDDARKDSGRQEFEVKVDPDSYEIVSERED